MAIGTVEACGVFPMSAFFYQYPRGSAETSFWAQALEPGAWGQISGPLWPSCVYLDTWAGIFFYLTKHNIWLVRMKKGQGEDTKC